MTMNFSSQGGGAQGAHNSSFFSGADGIGEVSANIHGSVPTYLADAQFVEPNLRHFDFFYNDVDVPNEGVVDRLYNSTDSDHPKLRTFWGRDLRVAPVIVTSLGGALLCNYTYTRLINRTAASVRWTFFMWWSIMIVYNNTTKWIWRERMFQRDFLRNQAYAQDELRYQRDKQRVRETLYLKQFVNHPLAEYRVKAWQLADRFN